MKKGSLRSFWPVIDGHADTLVQSLAEKRNFYQRSQRGALDLPRLYQAGVDLQILAICAGKRQAPYQWAIKLLDSWERESLASREVIWIREARDFQEWQESAKVGVILALEGAEPLEGDLRRLEEFYQRGIRIISLTWNWANPFAFGTSCQSDHGLTLLGRDLVYRAQKLGLLLDLSHLGPKSFKDLISIASRPVIVSHANAFALCAHRRNLRLWQAKAVAETGGTIGVTFYPPFIGKGVTTSSDLLLHIRYFLDNLGEDIPALGSDYDGIEIAPMDLQSVLDLENLVQAMEKSGFTQRLIGKVMGENLYNVLIQYFTGY